MVGFLMIEAEAACLLFSGPGNIPLLKSSTKNNKAFEKARGSFLLVAHLRLEQQEVEQERKQNNKPEIWNLIPTKRKATSSLLISTVIDVELNLSNSSVNDQQRTTASDKQHLKTLHLHSDHPHDLPPKQWLLLRQLQCFFFLRSNSYHNI